ncbi:hypothetical protein ACVW0P_003841 [Mucilaginibacter sp. UYNi724]
MKTLKLSIAALLTFAISACSQMKTIGQSMQMPAGIDNTAPLPTGTYFIVNGSKALTPLQPTIAQNVFLRPYSGSGMQKWEVKQFRTKKGFSYTMRLAGTDNMFFQPNAVKDHTPMIGPAGAGTSFRILAGPGAKEWFIKSTFYNGDALRSFVYSADSATEIRFEAAEPTDKFTWKFIPTTTE